MRTFTEWLLQQMRQPGLDYRTLARRSGLTACKIRQAVEQRVVPSAFAVRRLAKYFGANPEAALQLAAEQVAATTIAETPLERDPSVRSTSCRAADSAGSAMIWKPGCTRTKARPWPPHEDNRRSQLAVADARCRRPTSLRSFAIV